MTTLQGHSGGKKLQSKANPHTDNGQMRYEGTLTGKLTEWQIIFPEEGAIRQNSCH